MRTAKTQVSLGIQSLLSLHWAHSHFVGFVMLRLICPETPPPDWLSQEGKKMNILMAQDCGYACSSGQFSNALIRIPND